jgi:hypothetical protein
MFTFDPETLIPYPFPVITLRRDELAPPIVMSLPLEPILIPENVLQPEKVLATIVVEEPHIETAGPVLQPDMLTAPLVLPLPIFTPLDALPTEMLVPATVKFPIVVFCTVTLSPLISIPDVEALLI